MNNTTSIDNLIRLALIALMVVWSITILAPFVSILLWAIIVAVSAYPAFVWLTAKLGGRGGWAATILVVAVLVFLIGPIVTALPGFAESLRTFAGELRSGDLSIPPPPEAISTWPVIGEPLFRIWQQATTNLAEMVTQFRPQLQSAGLTLLKGVAAAGLGVLQFVLAAVIAGIMLGNHERLKQLAGQLFTKVAPESQGRFLTLTEQTVRGVTMGVIGVAIVQAILAGIGFAVMGIPAAALWAGLCLVLAVLQISIVLVVLPIAIYAFYNFDTLAAVLFVAWNVPILALDNVLKPILMGRGVDAPMLIIFIGAIGGFISFGFLGLFFGAVVLVIAYDLLVAWLAGTDADTLDAAEATAGAEQE